MRLDWNDIRARAAHFAYDWKDAHYERGETQSFYNEFFQVFGVRRRRVASFEFGVNLPENRRGFLDVFWKGKLLVEQKSAGRDLKPARHQALAYFPGLKDHDLPRYILLSDFQNFELYDLDIEPERPVRFKLSDLPNHVQDFGFIVGLERRIFRDQDPVNIKASEIMGALHDALKSSGYRGHALERLLVRLLFCLFADDTGIFQPLGIFEDYITNTREDGADVGAMLAQLFQVLNTADSERQLTLAAELNQFPYINGELFAENLPLPSFNRSMREKLIAACGFHWEAISPAIFGSLFQSVMEHVERRRKGAHYTSEKNILKVIEPLFMDELRAEFIRLKGRRDNSKRKALEDFHSRLGRLTFFDPACGCGNFLVIAYRELREVEIAILRELHPDAQLVTDIGIYTKINVDQFYGIEIEEFPARIAEVAMWMMDHIMNVRLSAAFGKAYARIPLTTAPNVRHADALEWDWHNVVAADRCSYVFGNPPFGGSKYQSEIQRNQVRRIAALGGSGGTLDYVTAWFLKAGDYIRSGVGKIAFVATNSITQGEQVAQLWPLMFERCALEIAFAHRTFEWFSDARGGAHVHCVIIGLTKRADEPTEKRLFSYETKDADAVESRHKMLSPYLIDAAKLADRHLVIRETSQRLSRDIPKMATGTQPIDNGHLIFDTPSRTDFLAAEPNARKFLKPFVGTEEFLYSIPRWILELKNAAPQELRSMPRVIAKLKLVRQFRESSKRKSTQNIAAFPTKFNVECIPKAAFLAVPEVSSEGRHYIPIGWLKPPTIPSNKIRIIERATLWHFGIITSKMHMAWSMIVGGRLESRFQYSVGINYNPFPWPEASDIARERICRLAQGILDKRANHKNATLADLYDADAMPSDLRRAHRALDRAVDLLYRKEVFTNDRERVEHLFSLYEALHAPVLVAARTSIHARRRVERS